LTLSELACVAARGFALLPGNSRLEYISQPLPSEEIPHTRFNDGGCDGKGRFFSGTLYSPKHNIPGRLYRYDPSDQTCVVADPGPFTVGRFIDPSVHWLLMRIRIPMASAGAQTRRSCQ
jgi:sugar lactone lactonase YvrE